MDFHLRRPWKPPSKNGAAPLLLFFHSASYAPLTELFPEGDGWLNGLAEEMYVLCPECPDDYYWLMHGDSWQEKGGQWVKDELGYDCWQGAAADEVDSLLMALLEEVVQSSQGSTKWSGTWAPVDRKRLFCAGVSMGGFACWEMAVRHPFLFAGIAPVASHYEPEHRRRHAIQALWGLPVFAIHGLGDMTCPLSTVQSLVDGLGRKAMLVQHERLQDSTGNEKSVHNSSGLFAFRPQNMGKILMDWFLRQEKSARGL